MPFSLVLLGATVVLLAGAGSVLELPWATGGLVAGGMALVSRQGMYWHADSDSAIAAKSTLCCVRFMINSSFVGVFKQCVCVTMPRATAVRGANRRDVPAEAGSA